MNKPFDPSLILLNGDIIAPKTGNSELDNGEIIEPGGDDGGDDSGFGD